MTEAPVPAEVGIIGDDETPSPEEARQRIERAPLDPDFTNALFDAAHPGHKSAVAQWDRLHQIAAGTPDAEADAEPAQTDPMAALDGPPPSAEDYRFEAVPHGLVPDTELQAKARQWFHAAGIPAPVAKTISHFWNRRAAHPPSPDEIDAEGHETERRLKAEWGDRYEARMALANTLVRDAGPVALRALQVSGLVNNAYLIRALVRAAESGAGKG